MARPASAFPTELELQILKILWERSPLPVRDVRQTLAGQGRDIAHTSVITTLNTMVRKKQLKRVRQGNAFLFSPRLTQSDVSEQVLGDVTQRVFDGSASALLVSLFQSADIDRAELKELRRMIDEKMKDA